MATISFPNELPTILDEREPLEPEMANPRQADSPVSAVGEAHETAPLDPTHLPHRDTLSLLDHRSRRRAIPRRIAPPGHYLRLEDSDCEAFVISLEDRIIHVGRSSTADLRFENAHVSRRHAIIVRYGSHVRVLDDRSCAGTFVNGTRIVACELHAGDIVRIGPVAFVYDVV